MSRQLTSANHQADGSGDFDEEHFAEIMQYLNLDASEEHPASSKTRPSSVQNGSKQVPSQRMVANHQMSGQSLSLEDFVTLTFPLIDLEREAEIAQSQDILLRKDPDKISSCKRVIQNLKVTDDSGKLVNRTLITLVNNAGGSKTPAKLDLKKLGKNSIVDIRPNKEEISGPALIGGVVFKMSEEELVIALDPAPQPDLDRPLQLEILANEVTYQRLKKNLKNLAEAEKDGPQGGGKLHRVLFGTAQPSFIQNPPMWKPFNKTLDLSQMRAVDKALAAQDVALIHGPPGTGKTTAVVELLLQELARGNKILACAASNMAVDNLVEKLVKASPKVNLVRVGHPARILPQVLDRCLDVAAAKSESGKNAKNRAADIKAANQRMQKLGHKDHAERKALVAEIKILAKEERHWLQEATREALASASIVCATLTGCGSFNLGPFSFSLTVIDEAAQAMEVDCWAALLKSPRAVLAGDHLQLPPTIVSKEAEKMGLGRTLFERLQDLYGERISEMLTVQYRMHEDIMTWSSNELYGGNVTAHASNAQHSLSDMEGFRQPEGSDEDIAGPLLLIDTAGCDMVEDIDDDFDDSKLNEGEARIALKHCQRLLDLGLQMTDIGIITPYSAQVACLKLHRPPELEALEVGTVDGFQGREKEAIVISMVRSNDEGNVGFLADNRRMNVAVTRARRHCAIVCDTETVSNDAFIKRLVDYFEQHGGYISAAQLED